MEWLELIQWFFIGSFCTGTYIAAFGRRDNSLDYGLGTMAISVIVIVVAEVIKRAI